MELIFMSILIGAFVTSVWAIIDIVAADLMKIQSWKKSGYKDTFFGVVAGAYVAIMMVGN